VACASGAGILASCFVAAYAASGEFVGGVIGTQITLFGGGWGGRRRRCGHIWRAGLLLAELNAAGRWTVAGGTCQLWCAGAEGWPKPGRARPGVKRHPITKAHGIPLSLSAEAV
jgi:hypothetical protein